MKRILWLSGIALGLWLGIYLWPHVDSSKEEQIQWPNLVSLNINRIIFKDFSLLNQTGKWKVRVKEQDFPANKEEVESLLRFISQNKHKRVLDKINSDKWSQFVLNKDNSLVIEAEEKQIQLILGGENPSQDGVYALSNILPNTLLLLPFDYGQKLKKNPKDFYQLAIFSFADEDLKKVQIEKKGQPYLVLKKGEKEDFQFLYPEEYKKEKVNSSEATSLFFNLATLKAQDLLYVDPKKLSPPLYTYTLELKNLTSFSLQIYSYEDSNYLLKLDKNPWYYLLDQAGLNGINKKPFLLKDRHFLNFAQEDVKRIELASPEKSLDIVYKDREKVWKVVGSGEEFSGASLYLWELQDLEYLDITSKLPSDLSVVLSLTLKNKMNKDLVDVEFFSTKDKDKFWVKIAEDRYYLVQTDLVKNLTSKLKEN